jgi:hypothetical protein
MLATLHLSMSDATGDSAIVEYIGGKQVIHHDRKYQVMTNSPFFDEQLALNEYWKQIGGTVMLPGTNRAGDRFTRALFYVNAIPKDENPVIALASVFSVIRKVSVPFGITTPNGPNISSTRWRTVADQKRKLYFFESALTPSTFWVDLKQVDFSSQTGKVKKLDLGKDQRNVFSGNTVKDFKEAEPFKFQGPRVRTNKRFRDRLNMPAHLTHRPSFCGLLVNERGKAGAFCVPPGVQIKRLTIPHWKLCPRWPSTFYNKGISSPMLILPRGLTITHPV